MRFPFVAVLSALVLVMLVGAAWVPGRTALDAQAHALPAQLKNKDHTARRCPHCGWIESKREIPAHDADPRAPRAYEYTVRMADGSSGLLREALPVRWRVGERLVFIGGAAD